MRKWVRRTLKLSGLSILGVIAFVGLTNYSVLSQANGLIYTRTDQIPAEPVAIVLGSSPRLGAVKNPYFEHRMDAAASLYRSGKVSKLLVSGDNSTKNYDEPTAMRDSLIARGVPTAAIVLDYAGFRTLDSIIRAKKVFGVQRCAIVTDDFHLPRALYIAANEGIDAVGFQTEPVPHSVSPWTYVREVGARSLVWLDLHVLNRQPRFLGPKEPL